MCLDLDAVNSIGFRSVALLQGLSLCMGSSPDKVFFLSHINTLLGLTTRARLVIIKCPALIVSKTSFRQVDKKSIHMLDHGPQTNAPQLLVALTSEQHAV